MITLEKALAYSRLAVNPRLEGYTLTSLGDVYRDVRALREAKLAYQQASELMKKTNDLSLEIYLTLAEAVLERIAGNEVACRKQIDDALEKVERSGSKFEHNLCLLELYALDLKFKNDKMLVDSFRELEEYFVAAGYQLEAFKASVYAALAVLKFEIGNSHERLADLLKPYEGGFKHQAIIQIGLEFKDLLQKAATDAGKDLEVNELLEEIHKFEDRKSNIYRIMRRHTSAVDFTSAKLTIKGFGRMQVKIGGKNITSSDWKTQTAQDLFFFILSHSEGVTKEEIGEAFWPDADEDTIKLRFKNSIYRLRRAIGAETITFTDNYYRFNRSLDYEYDVDTFLTEIELAKKSMDSSEMSDHYRAATSSYHGKFLPKIDQEWVIAAREKYHLAFVSAAMELGNYYFRSGKYTQALAIANRALEEDNFNEAAHRFTMQVYSALNDRPAVARQYEKCRKILKKELNIDPSPQTINLYNSLMQN